MSAAGGVRRHDLPIVEGLIGGFPRALLKLKNETLSELWGYQLAALMGVRVPRCVPFRLDGRINLAHPEQPLDRLPGDFGLLVEELPDWHDCESEQEAAALDPEVTGRALALRALDGGERSVFGTSDGKLYVVDLEGALPAYHHAFFLYDTLGQPRDDVGHTPGLSSKGHAREAARDFRRVGRLYARYAKLHLESVYNLAFECGMKVVVSMLAAQQRLRDLAKAGTLLRLTGHPRAKALRDAAERALRKRLREA
jgi:hypothetical protein